ncbi:glycosyl-transferase for dystroglycan-domain-containing protein [Chlamydoabsidia padenii]|nr:glycosyl-transferase for dystroglycan-domain-containing protein [Chlamydoabsidia padenii]
MVSELNIQSKLFSSALGPSTLKPYYFKASHLIHPKDITLSTLVTRNRFPVLGRLASHYQGPISVAIHINDDNSKDQVIKELHELYDSNPDVRQYVDIHLVIDPFDRQFNLWRNVAKLFARTDYIMMLDVDFYLCTDFRRRILTNPNLLALLDSGRGALVVPAFEYLLQDDGLDAATFPTHKEDLLNQLDQSKIDMFHKSWLNGHGATNYSKWYGASDLYKVTDYNFSYEPYVIFRKQGTPWCDERFIGYGGNKAACLYELYLAGLEYWVLPDDFLIHQTHSYPEDTRRKERQHNRKLYSNFREELCLRYSRKYIATGEWDTSRSDNLKNECQKIRGYRTALQN